MKLKTLIERDNVRAEFKFGAASKRASSQHMVNNWRVTLRMPNWRWPGKDRGWRRMSVDFYGGSAVRNPSAADVMSSLCLDANCGSNSFEDFCGELGYDADSIKALQMFKACQGIARRLLKFIGEQAMDEYRQAEH
jgi:hypothetical protein